MRRKEGKKKCNILVSNYGSVLRNNVVKGS